MLDWVSPTQISLLLWPCKWFLLASPKYILLRTAMHVSYCVMFFFTFCLGSSLKLAPLKGIGFNDFLPAHNAWISWPFGVQSDLIANTFFRNNKGDTLTASYYHLVNTEKNTAVGAEVTRIFSSKATTVTFGTQHALDPSTTVKARYNSDGIASALIQHEWRPKSFFSLSTEVNTKAFEKSSKVGLSLVLKPWWWCRSLFVIGWLGSHISTRGRVK